MGGQLRKRLPRPLTRLVFPFGRETPYISAFASKLQTGLCVSHAGAAASLSLMLPAFPSCAVKELSQAAWCICHGWAKGQAAARFLTTVFSGLLLVSAIFQCGWHHDTSKNLPSYNNKGASAQAKARARQIQERAQEGY